MSTVTRKTCYGGIFPDMRTKSAAGKVFRVEPTRPVGGVGRLRDTVRPSDEQWIDCTRCDDFNHCYEYSVAKLLMEAAVPQV